MLYEKAPAGFAEVKTKYGPYSPSRLIVARCGQRFFGQYVRKDKSVGYAMAAARGNAIHYVISKITYNIVNEKQTSPSDINQWVAAAVGMFPGSYDQVDMIKQAANAYLANPSPYITKETSCETGFAVKLYEEAGFEMDHTPMRAWVKAAFANPDGTPSNDSFMRMMLDQTSIDRSVSTPIVTILDHKSTPSASKNADHEFQVGVYAWIASLFYPGYQIRTVLHYCHPSLNFYGAPVYWSYEDLQEVENYLLDRIRAVEHFEDFTAMPGSHCDYCHMVQECEINLKLQEQQARGSVDLNVRSFQDLERLGKELKAIGTLYDQVNKAMKNGIDKFAPVGGVTVDGITYGYKASDEAVNWIATDVRLREEADRARNRLASGDFTEQEKPKLELMVKMGNLEGVLTHYGINPNSFKDWQGQKLKNLWRLDKPDMMDLLREYIVKERSTRYGGHKNF